jgi:hypothetical protein
MWHLAMPVEHPGHPLIEFVQEECPISGSYKLIVAACDISERMRFRHLLLRLRPPTVRLSQHPNLGCRTRFRSKNRCAAFLGGWEEPSGISRLIGMKTRIKIMLTGWRRYSGSRDASQPVN